MHTECLEGLKPQWLVWSLSSSETHSHLQAVAFKGAGEKKKLYSAYQTQVKTSVAMLATEPTSAWHLWWVSCPYLSQNFIHKQQMLSIQWRSVCKWLGRHMNTAWVLLMLQKLAWPLQTAPNMFSLEMRLKTNLKTASCDTERLHAR